MEFKRVTLPPQHYLYLERECRMADIAEHMGTAFGELLDFMARHGIQPSGAPMAVYPKMPSGEEIFFECGMIVSAKDAGKAERLVKSATLPEGPAMTCTHVGPYSELNRSHHALWDHMRAEGLDAGMPIWELYVDDPEKTAPEELRTEIYRHIAR
ncbi:GyrI-like domain-containing protein [Psychromarinibacter sp. C21-152]|uniref:GyrI-like domain-containing protein n=1 Tax=Psychromarinibacter sediminicola TaxID=3033385 RepID=A0AAE3T6P9_9RHOB|nr:GyrI-like domain-containing protein [Psychromarinibacter sediminicola]MDF0599497.1 GyrI-like domain-containing protein [Psychromarinibacter sediminicola]